MFRVAELKKWFRTEVRATWCLGVSESGLRSREQQQSEMDKVPRVRSGGSFLKDLDEVYGLGLVGFRVSRFRVSGLTSLGFQGWRSKI